MKAIVLAGGGGTRLWPLSREDFPKQFLRFGSGNSLLQMTLARLLNASFIDEIVVATNAHHLSLVQEQLKKVDTHQKVHILIEPSRKNTAPAIGLAIKYLQEFCQIKDSDPILVLPSDHMIEPEAIFLHSLEQMEAIAKEKWIITFGIRPTKPETGYGYIEIGQKYDAFTYEAVRFIEKPDKQTAEQYLKNPNFYWNSGMFIFSSETFWRQLKEHAPELYKSMLASYDDVKLRFAQMPNISIDYAIMEKSKETLICPLPVHWSDIGSWDSVYDILDKDQNQNVKIGQIIDVDTKNSLIIGGNRLISTIGLEDMLIVETEDATFIGKKGESQRIKTIVEELAINRKKEPRREQQFPWGFQKQIEENVQYQIQKLHIFSNQVFLNEDRNGLWLNLSGAIDLDIDGNLLKIAPFESIQIRQHQKIKNLSDASADFVAIWH